MMYEKYKNATQTLLELAKDRGYTTSSHINDNVFKQRFNYFSNNDFTALCRGTLNLKLYKRLGTRYSKMGLSKFSRVSIL